MRTAPTLRLQPLLPKNEFRCSYVLPAYVILIVSVRLLHRSEYWQSSSTFLQQLSTLIRDPRILEAMRAFVPPNFTMDEFAQTMNVSVPTVRRDMRLLEVWGYDAMQSA